MRINRWRPLRHIGTLRGEGTLIATSVRANVRYQIDLFRSGAMMTAAGEVEGRMAALVDQTGPLRLKLANGVEVGVTITGGGAELASFDADEAGAALCHQAAGLDADVSPAAAAARAGL
jgi:hypothetical protein